MLEDARAKVGAESVFAVRNETKGYEFQVKLEVSPRLRKVLLAGGLLNHTKEAEK